MNRLWVRLTLSFTLVVLIGIGSIALLAGTAIGQDFRSFVARNALEDSVIVDGLVNYYETHGSWDGIAAQIAQLASRPAQQPRPGNNPRGEPQGRFPETLLADANGRVVFANRRNRINTQLNGQERDNAIELQSNSTTIGYLVAFVPDLPDFLLPAETAFIDQTRRTLILAGLIAGGVGIVLGLAFSRNLTRPLNRLAVAARAIAAKDLTQRVEPTGSAEIKEVSHAFNDMATSLQQSEELRRNLVADVAHELRTPLSVLQGNLSAVIDGVYPLEMSEIARLYDETRLLGRIVDDLRELTQAEAGRLQLDRQSLDLTHIARSALLAFSAAALDKEISLIDDLPQDLPRVQADATRIGQVLRNLLTNAIRHTPNGGTVRVAASSGAGWVEISVSDSGEGIAPADLPHVFERFWRSDRSRARETGGSGLGLPIARQLILAHGGYIGAESTPGQGSRFWFKLPIS